MLGAIAGDIIGSVYEWNNIKTKEFNLFTPWSRYTDDTVLTVALADAILTRKRYGEVMKAYYHQYPGAGYGGTFVKWASSDDTTPYNSWGNGSAMRTSPVGYAYATLEEVLAKAEHFAGFTHNHPEGVKGAKAVSSAIFLARSGSSKKEIKSFITDTIGYDLSRSLSDIRPGYRFDVSCQGSVPEALTAFLESVSYEDAVRNAVSIGGDSDTIACIAGGIAEAYYGEVPSGIRRQALDILDERLKHIVASFYTDIITSTAAENSFSNNNS